MSEELKNLFDFGKPQNVLDKFTQIESQGEWATLPEKEQIACIYYKCRSLEWLGRYKEALQTAATARTTYPSPKNPSNFLALLAAQFYTFFKLSQSRLDEAQSVLAEGEVIMEALTDKERQTGEYWIAVFEHVKGLDYFAKKELNLALEYYHKALTLFEALDNLHGIAQCLFGLGENYFYKNEWDSAIEYYQQSQNLYESLGNKLGMGECLHDIGLVNDGKGELDTALKYYQRGLSIAEVNENPFYIIQALVNIGRIYSVRGDPITALDHFRRSLAVAEPLGDDGMIAYIFENIAMAYHQKGASDIALPFFQSSIKKYESLKSDYGIMRVLFQLILMTLEQQELEQAQNYLNSLQNLIISIPDEAIAAYRRRRLAEALVLKESPRMIEKARAQALLRQIKNENWNVFPLTLMAILALCDLLLFELKATGEPEVWEEAKTLIHQVYNKAHNSQEFTMLVNALLLKARFAVVDGELNQAVKYFNEARTIIKEKNLNELMKKVETEQKEFEADFQKWQDLIQKHTSLEERLIQAQLTEYIQEAQKIVQRSPLKRP